MTRPQGSATDKLDDADYPPYTIGTAANLLGVQPAFLRSLDAAGLLTAGCSAVGNAATATPSSPWPPGSVNCLIRTCP